jgi:hypothetical protein
MSESAGKTTVPTHETSEMTSCGVAELVREPAVGEFVEGEADDENGREKEELSREVGQDKIHLLPTLPRIRES